MYDVIIIGAGPAGLTAGLYAGRSRLKTLIIEKGQDGGQIALTSEIENYPGSMLEGDSGQSLVKRMGEQVAKFGAERVRDIVKSVDLTNDVKKIICEKSTYESKSVIIATGCFPKPIGCKDEGMFIGRGISFCATCDANFYRGLEVYVVGGGDSAVEEAIYLTGFARHVTLIHRRDKLRAAKYIQDKAFKNEKLSFMWDTVVDEVGGEEILQYIIVKNVKTQETKKIEANPEDGMFGLFGFIGYNANSELFKSIIDMDESGNIITDENMHTNLKGVFAAGDIRKKSLKQVVTATADGAIAAMQAEKFINE